MFEVRSEPRHARQCIADCTGKRRFTRDAGELGVQPGFQIVEDRLYLRLPDLGSLTWRRSARLLFDRVEQRDALYGLVCDGRTLSSMNIHKLSPDMRHAGHLADIHRESSDGSICQRRLSSFSADIFPELRAFDSVPFERFAVFAVCPSVSFMVFSPVFKGGSSWFSYRSEYTYRKRPPIGGLHVSLKTHPDRLSAVMVTIYIERMACASSSSQTIMSRPMCMCLVMGKSRSI